MVVDSRSYIILAFRTVVVLSPSQLPGVAICSPPFFWLSFRVLFHRLEASCRGRRKDTFDLFTDALDAPDFFLSLFVELL